MTFIDIVTGVPVKTVKVKTIAPKVLRDAALQKQSKS